MLLSLLLSTSALAEDRVVIWVEAELPDEKTQKKVQRTLQAPVSHYTGADLAFPPQPWTEADAKAYAGLSRAMERNETRWEEFEVELSMADELDQAITAVHVVRDADDRDALLAAYLMQGAAIELGFTADELAEREKLAPYRYDLPGQAANAPLVHALALDPERAYARTDLATGSAYAAIRKLKAYVAEQAPAVLDTSMVPAGATLVINGTEVTEVGASLELPAGRHYVHLVRNGVVSGRATVDLFPATETVLPVLVDADELAAAGKVVDERSVDGLPEDVVHAISDIAAQHPEGQVFLASLTDEGKLRLVPYSAGAVIPEKQAVTFGMGATVGGGVVGTSAFRWADDAQDNSITDTIYAPAVQGAMDLELGIYNLAIVGGGELNITPTERLLAGSSDPNASASSNTSLPLTGRAHGGLGVYLLRPTDLGRPTVLLAGTYGWNSPGWMGPGGRLSLGIPMGSNSWFRIDVSASRGTLMPSWQAAGIDPGHTMVTGGLRIGFFNAF